MEPLSIITAVINFMTSVIGMKNKFKSSKNGHMTLFQITVLSLLAGFLILVIAICFIFIKNPKN